MVKRRGYRIELGEIERALYLHPHVREAAVVSAADEDGGVRIVACLSCHDGPEPVDRRTEDFLRLASAGLHEPRSVRVPRELPRTSTDKVDYQTLRQADAAVMTVCTVAAAEVDRITARPGVCQPLEAALPVVVARSV